MITRWDDDQIPVITKWDGERDTKAGTVNHLRRRCKIVQGLFITIFVFNDFFDDHYIEGGCPGTSWESKYISRLG